jgi:chromosome segregation ATPase
MSEEVNKDFDEMLEDVLGGADETADHSPEAEDTEKSFEAEETAAPESEGETAVEAEEPSESDSAQDEGEAKGAEGAPATDSVPEVKEPSPDAEKTALQEEVTNYKKRLHDTQEAMHKANEERAKLQKELDDLRKQSEKQEETPGGDNWFAEEEPADNKSAELESKIKAVEEKQEAFQREQAVMNWQKEAENFAKDHSDFNELVYDKLEPLLDETSGDPAVLAAYMRWQDKTPSGAYEFAKKFFGIEEKLTGAPQKTEQEAKASIDPTKGKAGLDRMNSAEFAEPKREAGNMIDDVFG